MVLHSWTSTEVAKYNHRRLHRELSEEPSIDVLRAALVVGDTAGHTYPALAVADALRAREPGAQILFVGSAPSVAASLVERAGLPFVPVPGRAIRRANLIGLALAAHQSAHAIVVARRLLVEHQIQFVMGFGSFATGGVILAARSRGLPTAILEANVDFGLANRWLRPWVTRVFLGLGSPASQVVGVPVRASIVSLGEAPLRRHSGPIRILVISGSRGADFFSARMPEVCRHLAAGGVSVEVRQQATSVQALRERYGSMAISATVEPFVHDMAAAYAWADVVIARGGANTIAELAMAGRPALLVPLADASANHQAANADLWGRSGAGLAVSEHAWHDAVVASWLTTMATDVDAWQASAHASRRLARPDAATHIAEACVRLVRRSQ